MNDQANGHGLTVRQVGPYRIEALIGAGGMGQVYRARDTRLDRDVAIKVLPDEFARNPDRVARFEREATILASLNHPNIAHIHGIEETDGILALVMEYVRGDTLAGRRLTMDEALKVAHQIVAALEAAHEKGIVHRDLKPANVMVTPNGVVKVLDFGLAKLADSNDRSVRLQPDLTASLTMLTDGRTREGMLLGTGAYMSPEQARGHAVDQRTDIWAFGCVLYEILTGRAAFGNDTLSDTIAAIIEREPDWQRLPASTPDSVRRLLRRCFQKDPNRRLADIRDARWDLDEAPADLAKGAEPSTRARRLERFAWAAALLVAVIVAAVMIGRPSEQATRDPRQVRFQIPSPPTRDPGSVAISPDARQIVFAATADGRTMLWVHSLDAGSARPLMGTDDGQMPFWRPNGRSVGFFSKGRLKRIDLDSGTVLPLADAPNPRGGTWTDDDQILFIPLGGSPVLEMSSSGGGVTAIESTTGFGAPSFPHSLSGTRRVLFSAGAGVYAGDRDGPGRQRLADRALATAAGDALIFIRDRALFAQRFSPATLELAGTPTQIATDVTAVSVASDGSIAYRSGEARSQLSWFDRSGTEVGRAGEPGGLVPSISHDGRRVVMMREATGPRSVNAGIWIWDIERDSFSRFLAAPPVGNTPIWSYDDTRIVYSSVRNGQPFAMYDRPVEGGGAERVVLQTDQAVFANDWSRDGVLIYRSNQTKTGNLDLWTLSVKDGRQETKPLVQTAFDEREAQFSPDGRWFAYQSNRTGQHEIYIGPFPDDGRKGYGPVSVNGGTQVRWNNNGKELFYLSSDERLMAVPISTTANGQTIEAGKPVALFQTHIVETGVLGQQYVVSRDGKRFLILSTQEAVSPITVILNLK